MTLKELSKQYTEQRHSNIPEHARPRHNFKEGSSNELTKSILAYFKLKNIMAWRQDSEGRYRPGKEGVNTIGKRFQEKGLWIPGSKKGQGDVTAIVNGKYVSIEIKIGKDRLSDVQKKFKQQVESSGGIYFVVKTWQDFIFQMEQL